MAGHHHHTKFREAVVTFDRERVKYCEYSANFLPLVIRDRALLYRLCHAESDADMAWDSFRDLVELADAAFLKKITHQEVSTFHWDVPGTVRRSMSAFLSLI